MDDRTRSALLDLIHQRKPPGVSDLDAALNALASHAETIRRQARRIGEQEGGIRGLLVLVGGDA